MLSSAIAQQIEQALRGLHYGTVQLVIHDATLVRIERIERLRLTVSTEAASSQTSQPTTSLEAWPEIPQEE